MNKYKNELLYFIIYFIFVMIFPALWIPTLQPIFYFSSTNIFMWIAISLVATIIILAEFKVQFLMILIPVLKIRKTTKNPLLLRLLTDIKLNNKIFAIGFCFDLLITLLICIITILTKNENNTFPFTLAYWIYFSFTINYFIIYLFVVLQSIPANKLEE